MLPLRRQRGHFYFVRRGHYYLGATFLAEFERVATLLASNHGFGTPTTGLRRSFPLRHFPYSLIYSSTGEDIRILVVGHQHRRPGYWPGCCPVQHRAWLEPCVQYTLRALGVASIRTRPVLRQTPGAWHGLRRWPGCHTDSRHGSMAGYFSSYRLCRESGSPCILLRLCHCVHLGV